MQRFSRLFQDQDVRMSIKSPTNDKADTSLTLSEADQLFKQGLTYHQQGNLEQASTIYQLLLSNYPLHYDALYLSGLIAAQTKNLLLAVELIGKAIEINPNHSSAFSNLGNALFELNRIDEALINYDKAIAINPVYAEAYTNRGVALQELRLLEEALSSYDMAIAINPIYADAYSNRGNVLQELSRMEEAISCYDRAIAIEPNYAEAHSNRGVALQKLKRLNEAVASYDMAIGIHPNYTKALINRGVALHGLNRVEEALACYEQAIAINPSYEDAYSNLGNLLNELNKLEDALRCYDKAIEIKPDFADAYINRGITLQELKRLDEAIASFDKAISLETNNAEAYWNKALTILLSGDYQQGWEFYEWRWKRESFSFLKRDFFSTLWVGNENIQGKTLLLHTEQGLGDTIQFCRYVNLVKALGAIVVLEVPKSLLALFSSLKDVDELIEIGRQLPAFDYHCPLMSLPFAFNTNMNSIPTPKYYLAATSQKCDVWNQRLGLKSKPRVGLVWSGSHTHTNDHNRSLTLQQLLPHLNESCEFVSLQKDVREIDKELLKKSDIRHFGDLLKDFTDTAALCELMDLVICVDTSVAHLSGAMGKNTWVLLPYAPDWRWLLNRNDSPWYESIKLFRQGEDREWPSLLDNVFMNLRLFLSELKNGVNESI